MPHGQRLSLNAWVRVHRVEWSKWYVQKQSRPTNIIVPSAALWADHLYSMKRHNIFILAVLLNIIMLEHQRV